MAKYKFLKIEEYPAVGGPEKRYKDENGHWADPTRKGRFVIYRIGKHLSSTYPFSSGIEWGTPLRVQDNKAQIKKGGVWVNISSTKGFTQFASSPEREKMILEFIRDQYNLYKIETLKKDAGSLTPQEKAAKYPSSWIFNDFGHVTIKYFVDKNGDYKLNKGEDVISDYLHTTPYNEFFTKHEVSFNLGESHGCTHVKPKDIDTFINNGYVKISSVIEVKPYTETYIPLNFEADYGRPDYELHFYPGLHKIIVYMVSISSNE